jgi:hypothetical protein
MSESGSNFNSRILLCISRRAKYGPLALLLDFLSYKKGKQFRKGGRMKTNSFTHLRNEIKTGVNNRIISSLDELKTGMQIVLIVIPTIGTERREKLIYNSDNEKVIQ